AAAVDAAAPDGIAATQLRGVFSTLIHQGIHGLGNGLKVSLTHLRGVKRGKAGAFNHDLPPCKG
ncbi:MAG: hypothetical protein QGG19_19785, partial [Alphaproteobacteria bacterium]|nr:hypothetical protein [Alphaproteobacteria bacterium]